MIHCLRTDFKEKHYVYFFMFSFCSPLNVVEKTCYLRKKKEFLCVVMMRVFCLYGEF